MSIFIGQFRETVTPLMCS